MPAHENGRQSGRGAAGVCVKGTFMSDSAGRLLVLTKKGDMGVTKESAEGRPKTKMARAHEKSPGRANPLPTRPPGLFFMSGLPAAPGYQRRLEGGSAVVNPVFPKPQL